MCLFVCLSKKSLTQGNTCFAAMSSEQTTFEKYLFYPMHFLVLPVPYAYCPLW